MTTDKLVSLLAEVQQHSRVLSLSLKTFISELEVEVADEEDDDRLDELRDLTILIEEEINTLDSIIETKIPDPVEAEAEEDEATD